MNAKSFFFVNGWMLKVKGYLLHISAWSTRSKCYGVLLAMGNELYDGDYIHQTAYLRCLLALFFVKLPRMRMTMVVVIRIRGLLSDAFCYMCFIGRGNKKTANDL